MYCLYIYYVYIWHMKKGIDLPSVAIKILQKEADKEGRKLKNYMEYILIKHSKTLLNIKL